MIDILKAIADETRLRILAQVFQKEMCVCEIESSLGLTQSNVSRHLIILKKAGVLESYKSAQWSYYKINSQFIAENRELYAYLQRKVSSIPSYQTDCANSAKLKQLDLCSCKKSKN